jgi:outer membrane protein TolC
MSFLRYFLTSSIGTVLVLSAIIAPPVRADRSPTRTPAALGDRLGSVYRGVSPTLEAEITEEQTHGQRNASFSDQEERAAQPRASARRREVGRPASTLALADPEPDPAAVETPPVDDAAVAEADRPAVAATDVETGAVTNADLADDAAIAQIIGPFPELTPGGSEDLPDAAPEDTSEPDTSEPADEIEDPIEDDREDVVDEADEATDDDTDDEATVPDAEMPAPVVRPSLTPSPSPVVEVPEYLNPSPNRLFFPTRDEEVAIAETTPITLEQAIELARRNSVALQEAYLNLEVAEAALRQAQAANLPTLDAQGSIVRQDVNDSAPPPIFGEEPDSTSTTLGGGLVLNYDIFTSGRRSALIRAAEYRVRLQELQIEVVSEQLTLDVTNAYYDLQESDEQVRIDRSALERAQQSLRDAEALERAGVGTRFSVLTAQVDAANAQQELFRSLSNQQIARREMVRLLNLSQVSNVAAADAVEPAPDWPLSLEATITLAYQNRAELEQQLLQRDISDRLRRAELAALGPQFSAFARYDFQDLLGETNTSSDREVYQVGLQFNMRLFDGGAARAGARQEERNIELAENAFTNARNQIRFQVEQAYYNLQANRANIETATLAVETATEALRLARLRFQAGIETQTDVLLAQTDLTRAEVNRLRAILDYNRALATLRRATSNFPDSDLSDRP